MSEHPVGDGADEKFGHVLPAVCTDDDQVDVVFGSSVQYCTGRSADEHSAPGGLFLSVFLCEAVQARSFGFACVFEGGIELGVVKAGARRPEHDVEIFGASARCRQCGCPASARCREPRVVDRDQRTLEPAVVWEVSLLRVSNDEHGTRGFAGNACGDAAEEKTVAITVITVEPITIRSADNSCVTARIPKSIRSG